MNAATTPTPPAPPTAKPYTRIENPQPIDLYLDANEGRGPSAQFISAALSAAGPGAISRYPDSRPLERLIAQKLGVLPEEVVVTAGADDALARIIEAFSAAGDRIVTTRPTFEMIGRYARARGADLCEIDWLGGAFPTEMMATEAATAKLAFVVSPNNPTGGAATTSDLNRVLSACSSGIVVLDEAYAEFAESPLGGGSLLSKAKSNGAAAPRSSLPANLIKVGTLSKAWGLAGLRVGFAVGPRELIDRLRAVGQPYAVSGASLAVALAWLQSGDDSVAATVANVRSERDELSRAIAELGGTTLETQGNFLLAHFSNAPLARDGLAASGIAVRAFSGKPLLQNRIRITCPGEPTAFTRLAEALRTTLAPQSLLVDMDGVLADVSRSYRRAILDTAATFGITLTADDVRAGKRAGNANNDWILTHRLLTSRGVETTLAEVTTRFEAIYQGTPGKPGLRETESLILSREQLETLAAKLPMAIVTGRPRRDAVLFLERFGIADLFKAVVCMEDGPSKPDPTILGIALDRLGASRGWMLGDTRDDITAARALSGSRAIAIGCIAPGEDPADASNTLLRAGAARVVANAADILEFLP